MYTLTQPEITSLPLLHQGKVRYVYAVDDKHLLIVTSDKLSAYDVVLPSAIPDKGRILNQLSCFWFKQLQAIVPNHISALSPKDVLSPAECSSELLARSVVVERLQAIPFEAVIRGYLFGSLWRDYQAGQLGQLDERLKLPVGMQQAQKLPTPLFTPTTKAAVGDHDEAVTYQAMAAACGAERAEHIRKVSLTIYQQASTYALARGIIIADTKLEFGLNQQGQLVLMDELLTPDSSRFWMAAAYQKDSSIDQSPPSLDKQYVRDYLDSISWRPESPPVLPATVVIRTAEKYQQAAHQLMAN